MISHRHRAQAHDGAWAVAGAGLVYTSDFGWLRKNLRAPFKGDYHIYIYIYIFKKNLYFIMYYMKNYKLSYAYMSYMYTFIDTLVLLGFGGGHKV